MNRKDEPDDEPDVHVLPTRISPPSLPTQPMSNALPTRPMSNALPTRPISNALPTRPMASAPPSPPKPVPPPEKGGLLRVLGSIFGERESIAPADPTIEISRRVEDLLRRARASGAGVPRAFLVTLRDPKERPIVRERLFAAGMEAAIFRALAGTAFARDLPRRIFFRYQPGQPPGIDVTDELGSATRIRLRYADKSRDFGGPSGSETVYVGRGQHRHLMRGVPNDLALPDEHGFVSRDAFWLRFDHGRLAWELRVNDDVMATTRLRRAGSDRDDRLRQSGILLGGGDRIVIAGPGQGQRLDIEFLEI